MGMATEKGYSNYYPEAYDELKARFGIRKPFNPVAGKTALLVVDMQNLFASPSHGIGRRALGKGLHDLHCRYFARVAQVEKNIKALIQASRENGLEVVYSRIVSNTSHGRDLNPLIRNFHFIAPKDSAEAAILPSLQPQPNDLVIDRTTFGVFTEPSNEQALRNMGIGRLVICGVMTDTSIATTGRDAAERGFWAMIGGDACTALEERDHTAILEPSHLWFAYVATTHEILQRIRESNPAAAKEGGQSHEGPARRPS